MKYLLLCLFALLTTDISFAQTDVSDYYLRHFTSEHGLPQNTVKSIARDGYSFIWLATEAGLVRFDGTNFKLFDKNNTGIRSSRMYDIRRVPGSNILLAISSSDELLIIADGKVQKLASGGFSTSLYTPAKKIINYPFTWQQGQSWSDSLFFNLGKQRAALIALQHGITWYAGGQQAGYTAMPQLARSKELFLFDGAVYRIADAAAADTLQRIIPGSCYNVAFKGDFAAAQKKHRTTTYQIGQNPATGQTFLCAGQCLYLAEPLPGGNIHTRLLLSGFDLDRELISSICYDSVHQRIFMGSLINGLYVLERKKFYTAVYSGRYAHPTVNVIYDQLAFNDSAVYTGNGTLLFTNPRIAPLYRNVTGKPGIPYANHVFRSRNGDIWSCGRSSVFLLDSTASHIKKEWPFPGPMTITEGRDGRIWLGTEHSGLYVLNPQDPNPSFQLRLHTRQHIMSMAWETAQWLWLCTAPHLLRFNIRTGTTDTIVSLNNAMARSVYIPRPGEVWICTYEKGLYLWQQGRLTHFPLARYPHLKTVHKILEDDQGYFWISTNHGMYQAMRNELLAYAAGTKRDEPYFYYYNKETGFLTNEFNGGSAYTGTKLRNGFFSFSSMDGIVFFRPSVLHPELPEDAFIIDKLEADDKEIIACDNMVTLKRGFRSFKITTASAYMGDPANLRYEFRLNADSSWSNTYNNAVILSPLPAGYTTVFIRKKAGFGTENYSSCKLLLYVPPPWWQTYWFYITAGVLLAALIWLFVRLRVRYWKQRNLQLEAAIQRRTQDLKDIIHDLEHSENRLGEQLQFQTKLNEQITHDITTPLRYLGSFTAQALNRTGEENDITRADLAYVHADVNRIYDVVQNLAHYMRTRLSDNSPGTRFSLHELVKQKTALFTTAATAGNNIIENRTDPTLFMHHNESLIGIVLHNLVDNAVKNTENGKITISATVENGRVALRIADTGKGMTAAQLQAYNDYFSQSQINRHLVNAGFGFQIIKEIAVLQKLQIQVASNHEKGLVFCVLIPETGYSSLSR